MNELWAASAALFCIGLAMVALRRQLIAMLLGVELMIAAVNIALVGAAARGGDFETLAGVLLILAVAAAEAVVGLSLILKLYQSGRGTVTDSLQELKG